MAWPCIAAMPVPLDPPTNVGAAVVQIQQAARTTQEACMQHAKQIELQRVNQSTCDQRTKDSEPYARRRHIDQRHADMRLERELREVWDE